MADTFKQQIGKNFENHACDFLKNNGLVLIEKNFRCNLGEIDLIMREGKDIIFVEVRSRNRHDYGDAIASINIHKQRKITKTANYYLQQKKWHNLNCRFDIIGIQYQQEKTSIEWIKNAFYE